MPRISVIINAYNYGRFIDDAIKSVLRQSVSRDLFELIVVDDGSTDDTQVRVSKYGNVLTYIHKPNGGQASALNIGLAVAKGEFVAFLDADDWWHEDKLAQVFSIFLQDTAVDVVYHPQHITDADGHVVGVFPKWYEKSFPSVPVDCCHPGISIFGSATSGIIWRRSTLKHLLPIPEHFVVCADAYLMAMAPLVARKFGFVRSPLSFYRMHGANRWAMLDAEQTCRAADEAGSNAYVELTQTHLLKYAQFHSVNNYRVVQNVNYARLRKSVVNALPAGRLPAINVVVKNRHVLVGMGLRLGFNKLILLLVLIIFYESGYTAIRDWFLSRVGADLVWKFNGRMNN